MENYFSSDFVEKNVLIIGGAGFVGSNLVNMLLHSNVNLITVIDNLLSSEKENLIKSSKIRFIEGSINNPKILDGIHDEYDYIFHLATFHGNQNSISRPLEDHENNTLTTLKLFDKIKDFNRIKKVVYSSAGCTVAEKTYDNPTATQEDSPVSLYLDSPYQISKIIGELYSNFYFNVFNLPVVKARFQNVYGPGEVLGAGEWRGTDSTIWRNVVPTFIYKLLNNQEIFLENNGDSSRDFIYVDDICEGLIFCAINGKSGEVYNLASGIETTISQLVDIISQFTNNKPIIIKKPKRSWDKSGKRFGSTEKAAKDIGFKAQTPIQIGIKNTIDWTLKNMTYINKNISKHFESDFLSK